MKKQNSDLSTEVSELLQQSTLLEVQEEVNRRFETAFQNLDFKTQKLLTAYLNGATVEQLSQCHSLTIQEISDWIHQAKRQLLRSLQRSTSVRQ